MKYVLIGSHSADNCPTSNAKTRELLLKSAPEIPNIAKKHGLNILAGPLVNREHETIVVVESNNSEAVDKFIVESRLHQWNKVRVLPSQLLQDSMNELSETTPLF
jgi:hypothetical protein